MINQFSAAKQQGLGCTNSHLGSTGYCYQACRCRRSSGVSHYCESVREKLLIWVRQKEAEVLKEGAYLDFSVIRTTYQARAELKFYTSVKPSPVNLVTTASVSRAVNLRQRPNCSPTDSSYHNSLCFQEAYIFDRKKAGNKPEICECSELFTRQSIHSIDLGPNYHRNFE